MIHNHCCLVVKRAPDPDESIFGYLLRLAELNIYDRPLWIPKMAGYQSNQRLSVDFVSRHLPTLASLTGVSPEVLRKIGYPALDAGWASGRVALPSGVPILRVLVEAKQAPVCPICFQEGRRTIPWHWEMSFTTVCPEHGRVMTHECRRCGKRLAWNRLGVATCCCGADLAGIVGGAAEPEELALVQILLRSAGASVSAPADGVFFPDGIEQLEFDRLVGLITMLAQPDCITATRAMQSFGTESPDRRRSLLIRVARTLADWPQRIDDYLERVAATHAVTNRGNGRNGRFGELSKAMRRNGTLGSIGFMHEAIEAHLGKLSRDGKALFRQVTEHTGVLSFGGVAAIAGVKDRRLLERMLDVGLLDGACDKAARAKVMNADIASAHRLARRIEGSVGVDGAAELLGLSRKIVQELLTEGALAAWRGPGQPLDGWWRVERVEIARFLKAATEGLASMPRPLGAVEFANLRQSCIRRSGLAPADVLRAVREGRLRPIGRNPDLPGLGGLLLSDDGLRALAASACPLDADGRADLNILGAARGA
ncbi:hypothetical protein F1643_00205 [Azospirillum sp. INR13]|uniref:TniQ family protein n=1 Tax=Azospirillum sp. INR13 TaxID=2596919 RepID=UPI001891FD05|nr:TniQ family protein [Azospirillum sp. INR13]MBF5093110.1 hypothetical protein [Azospirillum sp. INR13]